MTFTFIPADKENVSYEQVGDTRCMSTLTYDCGCVWEIEWNDIVSGHMKESNPIMFCNEHDPTTDEDGVAFND